MLKQDNKRSNAKSLDIHYKTISRTKKNEAGKSPIGKVSKHVEKLNKKLAIMQDKVKEATERGY